MDIVESLRAKVQTEGRYWNSETLSKAADEIERLREMLRAEEETSLREAQRADFCTAALRSIHDALDEYTEDDAQTYPDGVIAEIDRQWKRVVARAIDPTDVDNDKDIEE